MRIVVTRPDFFPGEAEAIVGMLNCGADRVHVRKPGASTAHIARLLDRIPPAYRKQLSLHDGFGLAVEYGIGGLHLNSRNPEAPRDFPGLLSRSCHSADELARHADLDYLFLSPIFPSISKPGYGSPGLLGQFASLSDKETTLPPVVALGGVRPRHASALAERGFAGVAMLGAAWAPIDISDFRLQFITPCGSPDQIVDNVREAVAGGCRWVQLRMKNARSAEILAVARRIEPVCHSAGATFLLDDRVDLVALAKADGVHLGKNDMPVDSARRVLGPGYIVGATANTFDDMAAAAALGADYIGLGPFRFTTTKKNLSPVLGPDGYRDIMARCRASGIRLPVVAIGGLDRDDFAGLCDAGVSGFAISGAIAQAPDRIKKTEETNQQIHNLPWIN